MCLLIECFYARHAEAELGPCTTAAPTTPNVISFVSDIDRSARWYRDNVGLAEASKPDIVERHDNQVMVMTRNQAGVTLISFGGASGFSRCVDDVLLAWRTSCSVAWLTATLPCRSRRNFDWASSIDFDNHVALVAQIDEDGRPSIVGGGRYIVVKPDQAEIAFVVVDAYQRQGIGAALMRHLARLAREAGLKELIAEVLPENTAMLKVFSKFGFRPGPNQEPRVVHLAKPLSWVSSLAPDSFRAERELNLSVLQLWTSNDVRWHMTRNPGFAVAAITISLFALVADDLPLS
jgi:ribosomal protein S18 acetylase RimI-like enzyme